MESPEASDAETEAGGGVEEEEEELDGAGAAAVAAAGFAVVVAFAAAATVRDEFDAGDDGDDESGRGAEALMATVLLLLNLKGVKLVHPGALVEACPKARGGSGGTAGGLAATAAKRSVVDAEGDDDNAIPRILFFSPTRAIGKGRTLRL